MDKNRVLVRKANLKDLKNLVKLSEKDWEYHRKFNNNGMNKLNQRLKKKFEKDFKEKIEKKKKRLLVLDCKGGLVGYFGLSLQKSNLFQKYKKFGSIDDAYLDKKYRKKGFGKKLFDESIIWFRENKVERVSLTVNSKNKIGLKAWKKYGFKEIVKVMERSI